MATQGSGTISRMSDELVVKHGNHVKVEEAMAMVFVKSRAPSIPVPTVYACYTIGPYDRDPDDYGPQTDVYIIMDFVPGDTLEATWDTLDRGAKSQLASELRLHVDTLRSLRDDKTGIYIGSVHQGALTDALFDRASAKGPFTHEEHFNDSLVQIYEEAVPGANMGYLLAGALAEHRHPIVFTHGDLRPSNILIHDQRIAGIVDWETSGFYPDYWEFVKAFAVAGWPKDWPEFVTDMLDPRFTELAVYDLIKRDIW
ncbi:kinase-like domain-containing protein [Elsinoe ampelina]|uniref:Kinase-like domain-containing protein n=1 Tax=Elsinoe ampelina TaxID=302913 RepID=A0A6A6G5B9_9PEZI|nr:kinase-like domain-containing protein [Elsinoe ampelina]